MFCHCWHARTGRDSCLKAGHRTERQATSCVELLCTGQTWFLHSALILPFWKAESWSKKDTRDMTWLHCTPAGQSLQHIQS